MKQAAICHLSVVPVRAEASDKSEIVTQLLFGELVTIIEPAKGKKNWCRIVCDYDNYEGWIDKRQISPITAKEEKNYRAGHQAYCLDTISNITNGDYFLTITMGATLPKFDGVTVLLAGKKYTFNGQAIQVLGMGYEVLGNDNLPDTSHLTPHTSTIPNTQYATPERIIKLARRYLFAPYLWGGRSPFGIDCSGFTQIVFKMSGIKLPRDASQQVELGETIDFLEQAQPADLAFFDNDKGNIIHVGIMLGDGKIMHASGQVRIDKIDHNGIYDETRKIYTHKLRVIKRLLFEIN